MSQPPPREGGLIMDDQDLLMRVVGALGGRRGGKLGAAGWWEMRCPAHDDNNPSLGVKANDPSERFPLRWKCHAGCSLAAIREAALSKGVPAEAFKPRENGQRPNGRRTLETYPYRDEDGNVLFETVRYTPKDFRQRHPDGNGGWVYDLRGVRRVLYRLPEVREGSAAGRWVVVVEGEKDADRLAREGIVATCSPMGAGKWSDEYAAVLAGAKVAILPDNDAPGRGHADQVARSLHGVASVVKVVELPGLGDKGDVFDWLEAGHTIDELKDLITKASEWEPQVQAAARTDGVYLTKASEVEPEEVIYFDEGLIPLRVVTIMSGVDGVGKSTVLYTKAAAATRGKLPGAFHGEPVDVVIASSEDHPGSVIIPRLVAAGADLDRVHIVKCRKDGFEGDIALPEDLPDVAAEVQKVGARLLIVDPLVAHLPLHVDSYKAQHVRSVLAPLARLAEDNELAVAAVVHFNGALSTDVRSRISGSKALRDAARSVLVCGEDPTDESQYVMVQDKHSFGPRSNTGRAYRIESRQVEIRGKAFSTSAVVWLGEVEVSSRGLLAGPEDPEQRSDLDRAKTFLKELVPPGERVEPREAEKAAASAEGLDAKALQRARHKLGWAVRSEGFAPKKWWWVRPVVLDNPVSVVLDNPVPDTPPVQYDETLMPEGEQGSPALVLDSLSKVSSTEGMSSTGDLKRTVSSTEEPDNPDAPEVRLARELGATVVEDEPLPDAPEGPLKRPHGPRDAHHGIGQQATIKSVDDADDPYGGLAGPNDPARFSR
jgi:putative DNA primase/helicase